MSIRHHPSPQLRADYVAADLAPGAALAVGAHLELCSACAIQVQALTGLPISAASPPDAPGGSERWAQELVKAPEILRGKPLGPWRWISRGVRGAELHGVSGLGEALWLLHLSPDGRLGAAAVRSLGLLVVLEGALLMGEVLLGPGDLVEALPSGVTLKPDAGQSAICLAASDDAWPRFGLKRLFRGD
jgi:anti-sigma factor ChrR (cupin superfamily)